ncbi:hypothetical protein ACOTC8_20735 [Achromobacter xylosoxidans]|uniref:hypothetical protein n=1 Tax=Alcaligenes xylosoxydans xylosoxydans TaxID=85698 RepID=UPI0006C698B2|nr:hypothetical protein [Achromobacter xylosoxidans]MCH1997354.1 hypothetical protein [Achromobacter xylosoxidans]MCH4582880.1 hypothetical protein [Achromobacter xylosoxidans]NYS15270.1 hypothetical protein [Achromobacter xylosoxidans]QEQ22849.1 hypothetical protein F0U64_10885 [Achromobacter xylosoxidans]QKI77838.1 hypothetical protein HPS43_21850 [Achromobacter xylosoxidans]
MIRKSVSTGWSALKDSYHLQQARQNFPEPEYLNALAQAIQDVKPGLCFRAAMREAIAVDDYAVGVLGGQELGKRTRAILEAQSAAVPAC